MSRRLLPSRARRRSWAVGASLSTGLMVGLPVWADGSASVLSTDAGAAKPSSARPEEQRGLWRTLNPDACTPLEAQDQARLPGSWQPYLAFTRRCELTAPGGRPAVSLISIFTLAYYEGKPDNAPWEKFPTPLLVDREFRCVGGLSQLFPWDQPAMLELKHGHWKEGVPQEIRVHVDNPAVSGPYDLPTLRWNAAQRRYQPVGTADATECPSQKS